jgi:hypothetical protein
MAREAITSNAPAEAAGQLWSSRVLIAAHQAHRHAWSMHFLFFFGSLLVFFLNQQKRQTKKKRKKIKFKAAGLPEQSTGDGRTIRCNSFAERKRRKKDCHPCRDQRLQLHRSLR